MNEPAKSCYLKSNDKALLTVHLPDKKPITIGRCPETDIRDSRCSKKQVELHADYQQYKVNIQQIGKRSCGFNGFKISPCMKFVGQHGDQLEVLYGKYIYQIEFNPPPPKTLLAEKRIREQDTSNENEENSPKVMKLEPGSPMEIKQECNSLKEIKQEPVEEVKQPGKNTKGILKYFNRPKMESSESIDTSPNVEQDRWESKDNGELLIYTTLGVEPCSKVAAYDLDGTLITTKSGMVFPKDFNDWRIIFSVVPSKLKELHRDGYKIVVFTNQASIGAKRTTPADFRTKIQRIIQRIGVPMQIFIATGYNIYRKPAIGMWQQLENENKPMPLDKASSFYVGDSAGRPKTWASGRKKDHSSADRLLALNLGLKFYTPEEHFLGSKPAPYELPLFNPKCLSNTEICLGSSITSNNQEVIIMVGCPASGKSYFAKNYLHCYGYVNRDSLNSWQKCVTTMEQHLDEKRSVVVDNTNPDRESRQRYIKTAEKYGVPVRCFVMTTSRDHAKHNNKFRELTDSRHAKITTAIFNCYFKTYEPPSLEEGFTEIVHVNFVPKFQNEEDQKLYEMYLLEE